MMTKKSTADYWRTINRKTVETSSVGFGRLR